MKTIDDGKILIFGEEIENAVEQIRSCMKHESAFRGILEADHHAGYKIPTIK